MAQMPPTREVSGDGATAQLAQLVDECNAALMALATYLEQTAIHLHPDIIALLKSEGLDGSNRFGMGSSANATANGFVALARRSAEYAETSGKLLRTMYLYWVKNIKVPVEVAQKARNTDRPKLGV
jgi:hypothetical protein